MNTTNENVKEDLKQESHIPFILLGMVLGSFLMYILPGFLKESIKSNDENLLKLQYKPTDYSAFCIAKMPPSIKIKTDGSKYLVEVWGEYGKGYLYGNDGHYGGMLAESVRPESQPKLFGDSCEAKRAVLKWFEQDNKGGEKSFKNFR